MPAGIVGADYWVYVNGRLQSAPPHGPTDPRSSAVMTVAVGGVNGDGSGTPNNGWDIWNRDGLVLRMRHESFDDRLNTYINTASGDEFHLFQVFELQVRPARYTVEIVVLSRGGSSTSPYMVSSFPFVVTRKYVSDVRPGEIVKLYPGVPDEWSQTRLAQAISADRVCPSGETPPDIGQVEGRVTEYLDDPIVKALRGAYRSSGVRSGRVVTLNLPVGQGGSREFDASQIRYIADAILAHYNLPGHDEVAACQRRYPQYSRSYSMYDRVLNSIDSDIESFRKLAADLERGE